MGTTLLTMIGASPFADHNLREPFGREPQHGNSGIDAVKRQISRMQSPVWSGLLVCLSDKARPTPQSWPVYMC